MENGDWAIITRKNGERHKEQYRRDLNSLSTKVHSAIYRNKREISSRIALFAFLVSIVLLK